VNSVSPEITRSLCADCGICCDGTLFHSVVLQPTDSPRTLSSLGLTLKRKPGLTTFRQPCSAHHNNQCAIYENRPQRCRLFNCQQLLRVASGEFTQSSAQETIASTRKRINQVVEKIERLTETNPNQGLTQRFSVALANTAPSPERTELEAAMTELQAILEKEFRVKEETD
jgi:Fe-S-cluster containining protein